MDARNGSECLPSLDPSETTEHRFGVEEPAGEEGFAPIEATATPAQTWLHATVRRDRLRTIAAFEESGDEQLTKRARRIENCCRCPLFVAKPEQPVGIFVGLCRDRMCPTCQRFRGAKAARQIGRVVERMNSPRFLTLTLVSSTIDLGERIDHLISSFKRLRRQLGWKRHVSFGAATIEVTRNGATGLWHPHLHVIIDGSFWAQPEIKAAWKEATGDSEIVHIRAVPDREKAAKYMATYIAKPAASGGWPRSELCNYAQALHGRRLVMIFGRKQERKEGTDDTGQEKGAAETLCSHARLLDHHRRGCPYAGLAVRLLRRAGGILARSVGGDPRFTTDPREELWKGDWNALTIALRRVGGDETAWLPEVEPARRFNGCANTGTPRDPTQLVMFAAQTEYR